MMVKSTSRGGDMQENEPDRPAPELPPDPDTSPEPDILFPEPDILHPEQDGTEAAD
jgi:hypothetical protein